MFEVIRIGEVLAVPFVLLLYFSHRAMRANHGGRRTIPIAIAITLLCVLGYLIWGAFPNAALTTKKLGGLTPEEVISRVGPPYDSPQKPANLSYSDWLAQRIAHGDRDAITFTYDDGHNSNWFPYHWGGYYYGVEFRDNRVAVVRVLKK